MRIHLILCMVLIFGAPCAAWSQNQLVRFEHLTSGQGLSQSNVLAILQDSRGYMWFGTQDGLNRYDGYSIKIYRKDQSHPHSISHNYIMGLLEDPQGNLWVATWGGGLNRFDRRTETFTAFKHNPLDPHSLSNDFINSICRDHLGNIWVSTSTGGLNVLQAGTSVFHHFLHDPANTRSLSDDLTTVIREDSRQRMWVGTYSGGLNLFDRSNNTFSCFRHDRQNPTTISGNNISSLMEDSRHRLWIGTNGTGLNVMEDGKTGFRSYQFKASAKQGICDNVVFSTAEDDNHLIWIGSENGGISVLDPENGLCKNYHANTLEFDGLSSSSINCVYKDVKGNIWIGTYNAGLNMVNRDADKFLHYKHTLDKSSLANNSVLALYEDSRQRLWVGMDGGGLDRLDRQSGTFLHYTHQPGNPQTICGNYVLSVCEDRQHNIWMGTFGSGLTVFNPETLKYHHYLKELNDSNSIKDNYAWCLFRDRDNTMWIGKTRNGLSRYDAQQDVFINYNQQQNGLCNNRVISIGQDSTGTIWVGTDGGGLSRLDRKTNHFSSYAHDSRPESLCDNSVNCLYTDKKGRLWIGTNQGLSCMTVSTGTIKNYHIADGLPNETIYGVLADSHDRLWISTNKGLSRFEPDSGSFKNFEASDGLQSNEFRQGYCTSKTGSLYFGGINGFNAVYPDSVRDNRYDPPLVLTDFLLSNKEVPIAEGKMDASPLKQSITETRLIELPYSNSVLSIQFASLNYTSERKKNYAYQLEGFDTAWNDVGSRRTAYYTHLDPGTYVFRVRGMDNEGRWSSRITSLSLRILPPYWMTWWFKLLIAGGMIGLVLGYYQYRMHRVRERERMLENQVQLRTAQLDLSIAEERKARLEAEQATKAKSIFLATMSHEIRTPMNGVIGMASLLRKTTLTAEQKLFADTICTSGDALLTVINDILDFSKIESGNIELESMDFHLADCVEGVLDVFAEKASHLDIDLIYHIDRQVPPDIRGDSVRLRQVLMNLVSNALKFTEHGEICVDVQVADKAGSAELTLQFTVRDTGIGIASDKLDKLFKAFSQVDSSTTRKYGGTGLGLVICEKLVGLMGGAMQVSSMPGKGSIFSFTLVTHASAPAIRSGPGINLESVSGKRVLLIDDNDTNRLILEKQFACWSLLPTLAPGGADAMRILEEGSSFDLVITDMHMPGMDGIELASRIRSRFPTLPIILLSSLADDHSQLSAGLFHAVLTKPIKHHILHEYVLRALGTITGGALLQEPAIVPIEELLSKRYPLRILLAEDNPVNQLLAIKMLQTMGYEPVIADNGREVIRLLGEQSFDLILMDVQMPEMDGLETTRWIRKEPSIQPVIIAMTANAMQSDEEACALAGMDDYLSKPVRLETLSGMIEKWISQAQMRSAI